MLNGKKALVTGSSRGIGRAIALGLAAEGCELIIHGAGNTEKANEVKGIIEANGGKATVIMANLCIPEETERLARAIEDVDILVLNASLQIKEKWQDITRAHAVEQLECNFVSSLTLIGAAVENMKSKGWGRIVTIGSVQEAKPHPDMLVYSASKAAQTNMIRSLSVQLAEYGITVNNVAPGVIYTDRNVEALSDKDYAAHVRSLIPVKFYGKPEDCVGTVKLLCSEDGRYITGQSIYIDGGKSVL